MDTPEGTDTGSPTAGTPLLVEATEDHLAELMPWFPDAQRCAVWGGPDFRFPFSDETFREDTHWGEMPSYSLVGAGGELLAFGQWYGRLGRCHLARLAVAPARRREGLGAVLVRSLAAEGCRRLGVEECSLFVASTNEPAASLYRRLGFGTVPLPEGASGPEGAVYMTAPLAAITSAGAST